MAGRSYLIFGFKLKVGPVLGERPHGRPPSGPPNGPAPLPQWARQDFVETLPSAAYIVAEQAELRLTDSA